MHLWHKFEKSEKLTSDSDVRDSHSSEVLVASVVSVLKHYVSSFSSYCIHKLLCPRFTATRLPGRVISIPHQPFTAKGGNNVFIHCNICNDNIHSKQCVNSSKDLCTLSAFFFTITPNHLVAVFRW